MKNDNPPIKSIISKFSIYASALLGIFLALAPGHQITANSAMPLAVGLLALMISLAQQHKHPRTHLVSEPSLTVKKIILLGVGVLLSIIWLLEYGDSKITNLPWLALVVLSLMSMYSVELLSHPKQ